MGLGKYLLSFLLFISAATPCVLHLFLLSLSFFIYSYGSFFRSVLFVHRCRVLSMLIVRYLSDTRSVCYSFLALFIFSFFHFLLLLLFTAVSLNTYRHQTPDCLFVFIGSIQGCSQFGDFHHIRRQRETIVNHLKE